MKTKEKVFLKDKVATKILKDESCREYVASIIACVLNIEKEYVMENLRLLDTEVNLNVHNKEQELDALFENDMAIINIEVNYKNTERSRKKNSIYIAQLILRQTYPRKDYLLSKPVIQINLNNFDYYGQNEFLYHSVTMEEKYHIERKDENREIYDINLDFLSELEYTEIEKLSERDLKWLLYIFVCQDEKLRTSLYEGNGMMGKVEKKMEDFMKEFDSILYYDHDEFERLNRKDSAYKLGKEEGIIETAKKMLSSNILPEQISEWTGLTIEEIEKLKEE